MDAVLEPAGEANQPDETQPAVKYPFTRSIYANVSPICTKRPGIWMCAAKILHKPKPPFGHF